jgi:C4-dicarboxylate-specific signal transduction histidine kinase
LDYHKHMKILLALNFFIFAAIQLGLLMGILHYLRGDKQSKPNAYWLSALLANIIGLICFGIGILYTIDIQKPPLIFTLANSLFYGGALCQGLFFYSLNQSVSKQLRLILLGSILIFAIVFEYLRQAWSFEARTVFAVLVYACILGWQIKEARIINKNQDLQQLRYFQYAAIGEAFFLIPRLVVLLSTKMPIQALDQLPQLLVIFTFAQILMNTLSFIAIWGYWSEKLAMENRQTEAEKDIFKKLVQERETLINSLLKVNKTSTTGALSASIAHEINQPLGAIQINSEYLQKKVQETEVDRELITRLASDIARDNMRAARIIRTLKVIFTEKYDAIPESIALSDVIDSVLLLSRPDIQEKQIQVQAEIDKGILLPMSFGEAQQLILNLINNSTQALDQVKQVHKQIVLRASQNQDELIFRVEDNGPGVPTDQQKGLFDLFSGTKREGMGLGLWLCSYIITRNGGRIRYDANFARGAAFEITFPKTE